MGRHRAFTILLLLVLGGLATQPAHAGYIDPNSGGLLFQLLAFLFASVSGVILLFSSRIRQGWARLRRRWRERGESKP